MRVEVTQFLRPNGRRRQISIDIPDDLYRCWQVVEANGARVTAEELTTGEVSLCIEEPRYGDFDGEVVRNGPEVRQALQSLIERFNPKAFGEWLAEVMNG